jgi:hypothetical protein
MGAKSQLFKGWNAIKLLLKWFFGLLCLLILVIWTFQHIEVNDYSNSEEAAFYLRDNGFHLDIILKEDSVFRAYGWGSQVFFTKVHEFEDLTFRTAYQSLFSEPASLMRVVEFSQIRKSWLKVRCSKVQLEIIEKYVHGSFTDKKFNHLYFHAIGNYNALNTCNTWVNNGLKKAGLKAVYYALLSKPLAQLYNSPIQ